MVSVLHVGHTDGGVADPVVDHRVHWGRGIILPTSWRNGLVKFSWAKGIPIVSFIGKISLYFP